MKSSNGYYYLVYVDSNSGKVKKTVGKVKKPEKAKGKITFKLNISGHPEYAQGKFAIGIKKSKSAYSVISPKSYVSNPEKLSKKIRQVILFRGQKKEFRLQISTS